LVVGPEEILSEAVQCGRGCENREVYFCSSKKRRIAKDYFRGYLPAVRFKLLSRIQGVNDSLIVKSSGLT
jgi:hypothetical protein